MSKWLFWGAIALAAFWIWKIHEGKKKRQAEQSKPQAPGPGKSSAALILACAHCGLHLPKDDAIETNGQWFCSKQHAQAGPRE
jgi:uncharacterized protein